VIAAEGYSLLPMAVSHLLFQLWEAGVEYVGFRKLFGFKRAHSLGIALLINAMYILSAMIFIR